MHYRGFSRVSLLVAAGALAIVMGAVGCSSGDSGSGGEKGGNEGAGGEGGQGFGVIDYSELEFSPASLQFNPGFVSTGAITITNVGSQQTAEIRNVTFKADTTAHFKIESVGATTLAPLASTQVVVAFDPALGGSPTGTLVVEHSLQPEQDALQIPLYVTAQGGSLNVAPTDLAFIDVQIGASLSKTTTISSVGTATFRLVAAEFTAESSTAFRVADVELPFDIGATGFFPLDVLYEPSHVGADEGELVLTFEGASDDQVLVSLFGTAISSKLVADPGIIDFGSVDLGGEVPRTLTLRNKGDAPIRIDSVLPTFGTLDAVSITSAPAWPVTLESDGVATIDLRFAPVEDYAYTNDPIGGLSVQATEGGDAGTGGSVQFVVPMYGNVSAPDLVVSPPFVDFGLVAKNDTIKRDLLLVNQGESPLVIESLAFSEDSGGEFAIVGWSPSGFGVGSSLASGETATVTFAFTNNTAGVIASGQFDIGSNDPLEPVLAVPLEAKRGGAKACVIELDPPARNFGIVPYGHTKTMPMKIKNVGTGPCTFQSATTYDCGTGVFGFLGNCAQGIGNTSKYYKVIGQPPPIPGGLGQGESVAINILFKPPTDAPLFDFLSAYNGAVQVRVTDPSNGNAEVQMPVAATAEDLSPNLIAQSGITDIGVIPGEVDFGLITIGCTSQETKLTIYNNGNAPLNVTDIELQDCTPEFSITQLPPIPPEGIEVNQANPIEVWVLYKPQLPSKSFCTLAVTSSDTDQPLLTVPLEGEGTFDTERTDTFVQASGKEVDILFVVDNSGSMSEEQQNLANNFKALIQEANTWGTNYHLGVVTTDMQSSSMKGRLQGNPRFVVPGASAESQFKSNIKVGDGGDGAQESGLEAAYRALTNPLIRETTISCSVDADCTSPDLCVGGICGGYNAGFLRDDATLEVVFVSDEEDQSPSPLNFYADFLKSIKGFANENLMHAHAIVGPKPNGCESDDGNASAGKRYIDVANQTGGKVGSICDASFAAVLNDIGTVAFGLKTQFFLSAQAQPGTVEVWVNGSGCLAGWSFDAASNSVIFDANGSCMPQENDAITINYKILCLQEG